jgi:hypothetical protein
LPELLCGNLRDLSRQAVCLFVRASRHKINKNIPVNPASSAPRHGARGFSQAKIRRAVIAEPNENVRSIGPKECANFTRHLHGIIYAESLQSLNVKNTIIEITISAFVAVNTLSLSIHLSCHDDSPIPAPGGAKNRTINQMSGIAIKKCELKTDEQSK